MVIYSFAFENFEFGNTDSQYIFEMQNLFIKIELVILLFFMIEILLNLYVYGIRLYYTSYWNIIDSFIIVNSVILAAVDLYTESNSFSSISRIVRGVSRFFRIFMLLRKMQQIKSVKAAYRYKHSSQLESVLEILREVKPKLDKAIHVKNLEWVIDVLVENKLYAPMLQEKNQESLERITEVNKWIEGYSPTKVKRRSASKTRRLSDVVSEEMIRKSLILDMSINIIRCFINIDELEFNCFKATEISAENSISHLLVYLFHKFEVHKELEIPSEKLVAFGQSIQKAYLSNPFHNFLHAFDTCQTINFFLSKLGFAKLANLSKLEIISLLVSAVGHDVEHP